MGITFKSNLYAVLKCENLWCCVFIIETFGTLVVCLKGLLDEIYTFKDALKLGSFKEC